MKNKKIFIDCENEANIVWQAESPPSALTGWYLSIRNTPMGRLSVGDVCRSLRQTLYLEEMIPLAVSCFTKNVLAGERYDGELLTALSMQEAMIWGKHQAAAREILCALQAFTGEMPPDVAATIVRLKMNIGSALEVSPIA